MTASGKKTAGIILAAGSASRMGKTKQLLPFQGKTLLGQVVRNARKSALHEIIVVLGHCADKIEQSIDFSGTKIIINTSYQEGQSTSLIKGLDAVSLCCDAAMFLLGDQPLITATIINRIVEAFRTSNTPVIIPYYKNKRGNPVIIARSLFHRLETLTADTGPRVLFDEFKESILKVPIFDDAILMDVDTLADYEKLLSGKYK